MASAKGHIYKGAYDRFGDILYTFDGEHIYKGAYKRFGDILYTFDGEHLYKGAYKRFGDIILTKDVPIPAFILLLIAN